MTGPADVQALERGQTRMRVPDPLAKETSRVMEAALALAHTDHETAAAGVVVADDLTRRYGAGETAVDALKGVSLAIPRGHLTAVMGPSGSGKSTLMHILAGLDTPSSGRVQIDGVELTTLRDNELTKLRRRHIGFVFQFFNLLPMLTAEENVLLPLSIAGEKPDKGWIAELRAATIADRVLFLADGVIVKELPRSSQADILEVLSEVARQ